MINTLLLSFFCQVDWLSVDLSVNINGRGFHGCCPSVTMVSKQEATVYIQLKEEPPRLPARDVKHAGI